jgi:hypothetical protein
MSNQMIADRDVVIRPTKMYTARLTKSDIRILRFYRSIGKVDRSLGTGLRFCRSLKTIAAEIGVNEKTVRRSNDHFRALGILSWVSGNSASWRKDSPEDRGQPNGYRLELRGITGYEILGVTPAILARVRRQIRKTTSLMPNEPNKT